MFNVWATPFWAWSAYVREVKAIADANRKSAAEANKRVGASRG